MYKRIIVMYLIMCACNHGHTNAYGAATVEDEKGRSLTGSGESMRGADDVTERREENAVQWLRMKLSNKNQDI